MAEFDDNFLPPVPFCIDFTGMRRSGKSTAVVNILTKLIIPKQEFDVLILCSPSSHQDMWKLIDWDMKINNWTEAERTLEAFLRQGQTLRETHPEDKVPQILFVVDDFISVDGYKRSHILKEISTCGRHANVSLIALSQTIVGNNIELRRNCDSHAFFVLGLDDLYAVYRQAGVTVEWKTFQRVAQWVWAQHPKQFLWIQKGAKASRSLFSNFKRITYSSEETRERDQLLSIKKTGDIEENPEQ